MCIIGLTISLSLQLGFYYFSLLGPSQGLRVQVDKPHPASVASTQPVVAGCALQVVRHCSNDSFEAAGLDSLCPIVHHAHLCYAQLVLLYIGQPKFGAQVTGSVFVLAGSHNIGSSTSLYKLVTRLLEARTITFSSDSLRKRQSL